MKRLLTAAVALPLLVAAIVWMPSRWLLLLSIAVVGVAVWEYIRLCRRLGADRVVELLIVFFPLAAFALAADLWGLNLNAPRALAIGALTVSGMMALVGLASRGESFRASVGAIGALSFGLAYFSLAAVSFVRVHEIGPGFLILLMMIVMAGDTSAYYVGSRWGRTRFAPVVSPNKTWLGAVASFVTALVGTALWCWISLGRFEPAIFVAAAVASVAAQLGDLLESLFKRAADVKDSGGLLPGHGGMLDRMDASLLAAPAFFLVLVALGVGS